jgi:hypothetical protein
MIEGLIFSLDDVRKVRKVSVNIDDFDMYAREAQANYLQKLIGDKLYVALLNDLQGGIPQSQRFIDLLDGVVYTSGRDTIFRGVKLYCAYVWLHLYMADSAISITPIGARLFKDENSDHNEAKKSYRNAEAHFINGADGLEEPTLRYLRDNASTYPEFSESYQIEQAEIDNMTFKVIGKRHTAPKNIFD